MSDTDYDLQTDAYALEHPKEYARCVELFERYGVGAISMCTGHTDPTLWAMMPLFYRKWKREKK